MDTFAKETIKSEQECSQSNLLDKTIEAYPAGDNSPLMERSARGKLLVFFSEFRHYHRTS